MMTGRRTPPIHTRSGRCPLIWPPALGVGRGGSLPLYSRSLSIPHVRRLCECHTPHHRCPKVAVLRLSQRSKRKAPAPPSDPPRPVRAGGGLRRDEPRWTQGQTDALISTVPATFQSRPWSVSWL